MRCCVVFVFFCKAEDGIRDLVRSRGLGDVYKRQEQIGTAKSLGMVFQTCPTNQQNVTGGYFDAVLKLCLLYTSDAADERSSVDLGGRRIIKKKKQVDVAVMRINNITV